METFKEYALFKAATVPSLLQGTTMRLRLKSIPQIEVAAAKGKSYCNTIILNITKKPYLPQQLRKQN